MPCARAGRRHPLDGRADFRNRRAEIRRARTALSYRQIPRASHAVMARALRTYCPRLTARPAFSGRLPQRPRNARATRNGSVRGLDLGLLGSALNRPAAAAVVMASPAAAAPHPLPCDLGRRHRDRVPPTDCSRSGARAAAELRVRAPRAGSPRATGSARSPPSALRRGRHCERRAAADLDSDPPAVNVAAVRSRRLLRILVTWNASTDASGISVNGVSERGRHASGDVCNHFSSLTAAWPEHHLQLHHGRHGASTPSLAASASAKALLPRQTGEVRLATQRCIRL